jgi:hypothetical protein
MFQPFLARVGEQGRVVLLPQAPSTTLLEVPFGAEVCPKPLLFWTPPRESYDGAWAHLTFPQYKKEECIRGLATLFAALKPRAPLWVSLHKGPTGQQDPSGLYTYDPDDFESCLRQSGFVPELKANPPADQNIVAWIARRL